MKNIDNGIQTAESFNWLKSCKTCNCDKSHLVDNEISQQSIITQIRVNHCLQTMMARHNQDTT